MPWDQGEGATDCDIKISASSLDPDSDPVLRGLREFGYVFALASTVESLLFDFRIFPSLSGSHLSILYCGQSAGRIIEGKMNSPYWSLS
jgi:hypothetical protein